MSLIQFLKTNGRSDFGYGSTAEQVTEGLSLDGKNILVTGCNSGLGAESKGTQKTANALHPGVIQTNLARNMNPILQFLFGLTSSIFLKSVDQGAATQVYVATHPTLANVSCEYFADNNISKCREDANDGELAKKLWEVSEKIVSELK